MPTYSYLTSLWYRWCIIFVLLVSSNVFAIESWCQSDTLPAPIYKVNPWLSGGIAAAGFVSNVIGLPKIKDKPMLSVEELDRLAKQEVSWFNQAGLRQDPSQRDNAHGVSDVLMYGSAALPFALFLNKKVRPQYWSISLMYLETLSLTSNLYTYSPIGPKFIDRYRPLAFYGELPYEERNSGNQRNSFYSGHVATTAVGTFFVAKVLSDYHQGPWGRKALYYGLAALPPTTAAVLRVRALKHFPSEVLVGGLIGAGMGILMPTLHRKWQNRINLSAAYGPAFKGGALVLTF